MCDPKIIYGHYKRCVAEKEEYIKFYMTDDIYTWYILISNLEGENGILKGGEYLIKLVIPSSFPQNPLEFYFQTKNEMFAVNQKVCISIGSYHPENGIPALGVYGFSIELVNIMVMHRELGHGISILDHNPEAIRAAAQKSRDYNRKRYGDLITKIEECYKEYSAKWVDVKAVEPPKPKGLAAKFAKPVPKLTAKKPAATDVETVTNKVAEVAIVEKK